MVPQIMTSFFQKYPKVKVNILEEAYSIQEKLLLNDQLDFGIFNEVHKHPKLEYELLKKEEILLIMHPEHPLAAAGSVSTHSIYRSLISHFWQKSLLSCIFQNRLPDSFRWKH